MNRRRVILLAAAIVVSGVGVALQFRRTNEPAAESDGRTAANSALNSAESSFPISATSTVVEATSTPKFAGQIESTADHSLTAAVSSALAEFDRRVFSGDSRSGLPTEPQNRDDRPSTPESSKLRSATSNPASSLPAHGTSPLFELNGEQKSHRVADGDTLARLAERYLGDPNRKLELYEYNRDVLSNPDVLPIGADLRIPPQIPIQIAAPQSELQTSQQEPSESQAPLAPLDPVLIKPQTARPETAQPASATPVSSTNLKHAKPRTYQVQIGDTLVDISRKLYGDGRRHEQLFEANRNVLKNPAALKPGMVLVVP